MRRSLTFEDLSERKKQRNGIRVCYNDHRHASISAIDPEYAQYASFTPRMEPTLLVSGCPWGTKDQCLRAITSWRVEHRISVDTMLENVSRQSDKS